VAILQGELVGLPGPEVDLGRAAEGQVVRDEGLQQPKAAELVEPQAQGGARGRHLHVDGLRLWHEKGHAGQHPFAVQPLDLDIHGLLLFASARIGRIRGGRPREERLRGEFGVWGEGRRHGRERWCQARMCPPPCGDTLVCRVRGAHGLKEGGRCPASFVGDLALCSAYSMAALQHVIRSLDSGGVASWPGPAAPAPPDGLGHGVRSPGLKLRARRSRTDPC
jgi:hypothetical protein